MSVLEFKRKSKSGLSASPSSQMAAPPAGVAAVGIDLGTTNSVVTILRPDESAPTTLSYEGSNLIPSMLYFDQKTKQELVGLKAHAHLEDDPAQVIKSTKRSIGKQNSVFFSHEKSYTAEQVATILLNYIAAHPVLVEEKKKFGAIWVVITVPAHFDDAARQATIGAAQAAGLQVLRIINEPTAAALAYSTVAENSASTQNPAYAAQETLAVFDLGGGTFDVTIVDKHDLAFNVLSSEGDVNLGGDDLDEALADFFLSQVKPDFIARRANKDSDLYRHLLVHAEKTKKLFQTEAVVSFSDSNLDGNQSSLEIEMTQHEFEKLIEPLLQKTILLTESAMRAAKRSPKTVSRILLVGGSSRLNLIRQMLFDYFGCEVDARLEPDLAVSFGASIQAAMILGIEVNTILVDVCSHTLGVGVVENPDAIQQNFKTVAKKFGISPSVSDLELQKQLGDRFDEFHQELQKLLHVAPILHRNSPLPARKSEFFNTVYHNQLAVHVVVVQGEKELVGENRLIGSFLFLLEQPCPKGTRCEIQLTYDVNGMVHVFAKQLGTQNHAKADFDSRTGEVTGWIKESVAALPPQAVQSNLVSLNFGSSHFQEDELNQLSFVNAVFLRAKRHLATLNKQSDDYSQLLTVTKRYGLLLQDAHKGIVNDAEVDQVESELMALLEGK